MRRLTASASVILILFNISISHAWFDETHLAIAKTAGYKKWYNAVSADIARVKIGKIEGYNHYHNGQKNADVTPEMVLQQADKYDTMDPDGHLYGAVIASLRTYMHAKAQGRYADHLLAYTIHYIGDLSMPLHHTMYSDFNKKNHKAIDGIIDDEVLGNLGKIRIYKIIIRSEADIATEVARIANLSKELGYRFADENRLITSEEAYQQISHSASLLKAVLAYAGS